MAQALLTDPLQSAEDNDSVSSGGSEPTPVRSIFGRYVKVVLYGPTESQKLKIWINPNSTFADVGRELLSNGQNQAILLQPKFGTMPYWSKADPNFVIANECRTLYALTISEEQPYLLGVVRTDVSDHPIAIFKPGDNSLTTVHQAIISTHPDLTGKIRLVSEYKGGVEDIKNQDLDFARRAIQSLGAPAAFFIATNQFPASFINGAPTNSIPPCLQIPFVNCEYLLGEDLTPHHFCDAITHVLRATLHIIISVSRGLHALFNEEYEDLQAALAADEDLSPLISVAPVLSDELISIMEKVERIINDRDTSDVNLGRIREELLGIFTALCGDFPGAVAVRSSSMDFGKLVGTRLLSQISSEIAFRLNQARSAKPDRAAHNSDPETTAASTVKLLAIKYKKQSAVAGCPGQFKDLENLIRELFSIPNNNPIFVFADIPFFNPERTRLHPSVWPELSKHVSVVWISDSSESSSVAGSTTSTPVISDNTKQVTIRIYLSHSDEGFEITIKNGSTIRDLKQAILSSRTPPPQYIAPNVVIRDRTFPVKILGDNEEVIDTFYYLQYLESVAQGVVG